MEEGKDEEGAGGGSSGTLCPVFSVSHHTQSPQNDQRIQSDSNRIELSPESMISDFGQNPPVLRTLGRNKKLTFMGCCFFMCFAAEKVTSLGKDWHRPCLRCEKCKKVLSSGSHAEVRCLCDV